MKEQFNDARIVSNFTNSFSDNLFRVSRFHTEIEKFRSQPNFHRTIYHRMVGKLFRFFFFLSLLRSLFTTSTTITTTTTTTQRSLQQPSVLPSLSPSPSPASLCVTKAGRRSGGGRWLSVLTRHRGAQLRCAWTRGCKRPACLTCLPCNPRAF